MYVYVCAAGGGWGRWGGGGVRLWGMVTTRMGTTDEHQQTVMNPWEKLQRGARKADDRMSRTITPTCSVPELFPSTWLMQSRNAMSIYARTSAGTQAGNEEPRTKTKLALTSNRSSLILRTVPLTV